MKNEERDNCKSISYMAPRSTYIYRAAARTRVKAQRGWVLCPDDYIQRKPFPASSQLEGHCERPRDSSRG